MIRQTRTHYEDSVLTRLLDESLSPDLAEVVQSHLADCQRCRVAIEKIAANDDYWQETVKVLSQSGSTLADAPVHSGVTVDWLTPLLQSAESGLGKLDRYPVSAVIGQGGMGVVLRAYDNELNRAVAVKVLSPHLAGVGAARARFMREAQAAAAIAHPSIVPIYSVAESARLPYLVMPLVDGGNLQERIDREGPLDLVEVLRIGVQVAEGLAAAHLRGVIHRDIKPANLLIEKGNGRILISDFGLARVLDDASVTCSGMIAGTPQYMSPEQARGETLDVRSDLFSLGSLLYALSTGRPPFRADNPLAVLKKISETPPRPIHQINERMPVWLDRLVGQLMTIEVDDRIRSADGAAELLRAAHAHVVRPSSNLLPGSVVKSMVSKRIKIAGVVVVVAALIVLIVACWWWNRPSPPSYSPVHSDVTAIKPVAPAATSPADFQWTDVRIDVGLQTLRQQIEHAEQALNPLPPNGFGP